MNVTTPHGETPGFRDEIRSFLEQNLPSDWAGVGALPDGERGAFIRRWRELTARAGLLAVSWPREYGGRGYSKLDHLAVAEEFAQAKVPLGAPGDTVSIKLFGNTVVKWGSPEQKLRFLPRVLSGEDVWCQGYSEPEAGSDLSSLRTRAVLRDGEWHIDGQKIWTSNAMNANWMFLLARTSPDVPKTRGITMLVMPMDQPGVEVRPIKMVTGGSEFCEVFFSDARTAAENVIGEVDQGWVVANSLLTQERGEEAAINPVLFGEELERLFELARERKADQDPLIRGRLTRCFIQLRVMQAMGKTILDAYIREGALGPAASVSKLYWSEYHQRVAELAVDILGKDALRWEGERPLKWFRSDNPGAPNDSASWLTIYLLNSKAGTIYAGTSEMQRNIIAERSLGLPRDPQVV